MDDDVGAGYWDLRHGVGRSQDPEANSWLSGQMARGPEGLSEAWDLGYPLEILGFQAVTLCI